MIANHNLSTFHYGDIELKESVFIKGMPYFTRRAIGEWLGYKKPQEAIDKILKRNPHIDNLPSSVHPSLGCTEDENPEWAVTVNLTGTDGKKYATRVYGAIGLQLIVFESRQPKAIEYKIAVARLVSDIITGKYLWNVLKLMCEKK